MPVDSCSSWALYFPILAAVARTDSLKRQRRDVTYHPDGLKKEQIPGVQKAPGDLSSSTKAAHLMDSVTSRNFNYSPRHLLCVTIKFNIADYHSSAHAEILPTKTVLLLRP